MTRPFLLANPVAQAFIMPPGAPPKAGRFRVTQDWGPSGVIAEPKVTLSQTLDGVKAGTYPLFHQGADLGNMRCGARVLAAATGIVDNIIITPTRHTVILRHGSRFRTWYAHLLDDGVRVGQRVSVGDLIGHVGKAGASACHLHFALEDKDCPCRIMAIARTASGKLTSSRSLIKFVDPLRRLTQNVTGSPVDDQVVIIRTTAGAGHVKGPEWGRSRGGVVIRADGLTFGKGPFKFGGWASGADWAVPGVGAGNGWTRLEIDGAMRYLAEDLAELSVK